MHRAGLDERLEKVAADEALAVGNSVGRIPCELVAGAFTNKRLGVCERDERWDAAVARPVGNDFDTAVLKDRNPRVGGTKINSDSFAGGGWAGGKSRMRSSRNRWSRGRSSGALPITLASAFLSGSSRRHLKYNANRAGNTKEEGVKSSEATVLMHSRPSQAK